MLQAVKPDKAGDTEDDTMTRTLQATVAKNEALRVYMAALCEKERTTVRSQITALLCAQGVAGVLPHVCYSVC